MYIQKQFNREERKAVGITPLRPIRIGDALWVRAKAKAETEGTNVSEVIRQLLAEWVERGVNS